MITSSKHYFIYNLQDDKDDIVMLCRCEKIEDFDVDFKNIKSFNIPRIIVKKDILQLNNCFNGKFKNILGLLYLLMISSYYNSGYVNVCSQTNWTQLLYNLNNKCRDSYSEHFFLDTNEFKSKDISTTPLYGYRTKFKKSKKIISSEECSQIYLDFLSL